MEELEKRIEENRKKLLSYSIMVKEDPKNTKVTFNSIQCCDGVLWTATFLTKIPGPFFGSEWHYVDSVHLTDPEELIRTAKAEENR